MSGELLKAVCVPAEDKDNDPDGGYDDDDADDLHCPGTEDTAGAASPRWCDRLVGLVVKASPSRAEGPGFESR